MASKQYLTLAAFFAAAAIALTGCASPSAEPIPQAPAPVVTDEETVGDPAADTSEPSNIEEPLEVVSPLAAALEIANASCEKAMDEGVRETFSDIGYVGVMLPEEEAIDSYSAAYLVDAEYGLIMSADWFLVCNFVVEYDMAAEGGLDPDDIFSVLDFNETGFTILVSHPDDYMYQYQASIGSDGFLETANILNSDGESTGNPAVIEYGFDASGIEIVQIAYDLTFSE